MATTTGLVEPFKSRVEQLLAAAGGKVTLESGFRTYDEQLALRHENGCPDVLHSPSSACRVPTAIPGTSQHEKGLAVDFGGDLDLVAQLAPRFGIARPRTASGALLIPSEAWHYEPIPGWEPPAPPYVPEDPGMLIDTPDGKLVHLVDGKLVWIRKIDPTSPAPTTLDLRKDPDTWATYLALFGPVH